MIKIIKNKISCKHQHNYNQYYSITISKGDQFLESAKELANNRAKSVNPSGPNGRIRSTDKIYRSNCRGVLAELLTDHILESEITPLHPKVKISRGEAFENDVEGISQIDTILTAPTKRYEIETRTSCITNPVEWGITSGYFRTLGWYTTKSKPKEVRKDYYFMYLYNFVEDETLRFFDNGIIVYFVGGADKALLQGPLGSNTTNQQPGANYRGISPICAGLDPEKILQHIMSNLV